jgi:hypothetical protein
LDDVVCCAGAGGASVAAAAAAAAAATAAAAEFANGEAVLEVVGAAASVMEGGTWCARVGERMGCLRGKKIWVQD